MKSIYDEFFRKEYERQYGQMGEGAFEQKMNELLRVMTKRIFYHWCDKYIYCINFVIYQLTNLSWIRGNKEGKTSLLKESPRKYNFFD